MGPDLLRSTRRNTPRAINELASQFRAALHKSEGQLDFQSLRRTAHRGYDTKSAW